MRWKPLWTPSEKQIKDSQINVFADYVQENTGFDWQQDYKNLWRWSVKEKQQFWSTLWDWHGVTGSKGRIILAEPDKMPGARFFPQGELNFAANLIGRADHRLALTSAREDGHKTRLTRAELDSKVRGLAGWLRAKGVEPGDRVAAYLPNSAETIIAMLATAAIGAVFSSCSPDFGLQGVLDRFGQIEPKILIATDGYFYNGKQIDRLEIVRALSAALPTLNGLLLLDYLQPGSAPASWPDGAELFDTACAAQPIENYVTMPFLAPLYILYSSGTTGAPKCIVHSAGGTLLQHIKEHRLHSNVGDGDTIFYFTTCGWMMWNWLASGLAMGAHLVLFDGNPFMPGPERLWQLAAEEKVSLFGTSAKYIDAVRKSGYRPADKVDLSSLRTLCSTGSPLTSDGFDYVYQGIKSDLQLASISGGTDIVSCFVLGCPVRPVYAGEIQARGLGMDMAILDEAGKRLTGEPGELCCLSPFPAMPLGFWNDGDGSRYHSAYFDVYDNIWRHGDWASMTERDGIIIHGRSDATLNPGGVRIGTAEIYRPVEAFGEIAEALVIGQPVADDVRIILFVRMAENHQLDEALQAQIKEAIRQFASPRHVPAKIIQISDIPRTRSGKITELAVRDVIIGRPVRNIEALANPEALELFRNLPELAS